MFAQLGPHRKALSFRQTADVRLIAFHVDRIEIRWQYLVEGRRKWFSALWPELDSREGRFTKRIINHATPAPPWSRAKHSADRLSDGQQMSAAQKQSFVRCERKFRLWGNRDLQRVRRLCLLSGDGKACPYGRHWALPRPPTRSAGMSAFGGGKARIYGRHWADCVDLVGVDRRLVL
jgi:hypothetical protein